jgi:hypothetical protein
MRHTKKKIGVFSPSSFIDSCSTQPRGARDAFGIRWRISVGKGSANPLEILLMIFFLNSSQFLMVDFGFPLVRWKLLSTILSS